LNDGRRLAVSSGSYFVPTTICRIKGIIDPRRGGGNFHVLASAWALMTEFDIGEIIVADDMWDRFINPISTAELERRWAAVRQAMDERRIDVLVLQSSNQFSGGYVRWFTGTPASNGTITTVVFPKGDRMTVITPGPFGMDREIKADDVSRRGVKRWLASPNFMGAHFTTADDVENLEKALDGFSGATIGLIQVGSMGHSHVDRLKTGKLGNARFVDATEMVDEIMVIKSDEEIAAIRQTAALQDKAMAAAFAAIKPGMRDYEVSAIAEHVSRDGGAEYGLLMAASAPIGTAILFQHFHTQNRVIQEGDWFAILVETTGPGGYFTELGRSCVVGKAPQAMRDEFDFAVEGQKFSVAMMEPGVACGDVWNSYNEFMRKNGRPEEKRLYSHGQGYNLVERPLVRPDDRMRLQARMNLAVHPMYPSKDTITWVCDNFLLMEHGIERLHQFPQKIIEVG